MPVIPTWYRTCNDEKNLIPNNQGGCNISAQEQSRDFNFDWTHRSSRKCFNFVRRGFDNCSYDIDIEGPSALKSDVTSQETRTEHIENYREDE